MNKFTTVCFLLATPFPLSCVAYDITTHTAMTNAAIKQSKISTAPNGSAVIKKLGLVDKSGVFGDKYLDIGDLLRSRSTTQYEQKLFSVVGDSDKTGLTLPGSMTIPGWIIRGAIREDDNTRETPRGDEPGGVFQRVFGHFFNPLTGRGLSSGVLTFGPPAPDWGLVAGTTVNAFPGINPVTGRNRYNVPTAREALWRALTLTTLQNGVTSEVSYSTNIQGFDSAAEQRANERKLYWATVFRSIGDVVHLIQDMAQPQHTRNDAHAGSGCVPLVGVCAAGHDSFYEKYLKARTLQTGQFTLENGSNDRAVNTRAPQLVYEGYPTPSFATYRDFFATNEPNAQGRGLANYSNRGFYSFGTNIGSSAGLDFPLPSPFGIGLGAVTLTGSALKNMTGGAMLGSQMRFLTGTVNDTATVGADTNVKLASEGVLDQFLEARTLLPRRTLNYYNYDDQARLLIPRAVAYSAGLIDYFFRGQLKILAPDEGVFGIIDHGSSADNCKDSCGFKKVKLKLANITDYTPQQGMTGGTVVAVAKFRKNTCYTTDLNGEYDSTQDSRTRAEYALQCRSAEESIVVSQALTNKTIPRCDPAITNDCEQKALPLTFVFDNAIPINATDLYLQVVYRGALGAEADAVVVETLDIAEPTYYLINSGEFKDEYDSNGNATLKLTDMKSSEGNRRMKAHIPLFGYLYSGVGANNQPCTGVANPADPMSGYPTPTVMKAVTIIFPD